MTSLVNLDLSFNQISTIPTSFQDMCSLRRLNLRNNNLTGQLPELFLNLTGWTKRALKELELTKNMLYGSFPDITEFSSLRELRISKNRLNGSFPEEFQQPSSLVELYLDGNWLWGSIPDLLLSVNGTVNEGLGQLSKLEQLIL